MTGSSLNATDRVDQPPQAEIKEIPIAHPSKTITVAPISINSIASR